MALVAISEHPPDLLLALRREAISRVSPRSVRLRAWFRSMPSKSSRFKPPHTQQSTVGSRGGRFRSSHALAQINFTARYSITYAMTNWTQMIGLLTEQDSL